MRTSARSMMPLLLLFALSLEIFTSHPAFGFLNNQNAAIVIGAPDFVSSVNPQVSFRDPSNLLFDSLGNLWLADSSNNRVIELQVASGSLHAEAILGQPSPNVGMPAVSAGGMFNPSGM